MRSWYSVGGYKANKADAYLYVHFFFSQGDTNISIKMLHTCLIRLSLICSYLLQSFLKYKMHFPRVPISSDLRTLFIISLSVVP